MERLLPVVWWLPKLGGEDAPSAPLPKAMSKSLHPLRTIILQDLLFQPGCAWWEVGGPVIPAGHERVLLCPLAGGGLSAPGEGWDGDQTSGKGRVVATSI